MSRSPNPLGFIPEAKLLRNRLGAITTEAKQLRYLLRVAEAVERHGADVIDCMVSIEIGQTADGRKIRATIPETTSEFDRSRIIKARDSHDAQSLIEILAELDGKLETSIVRNRRRQVARG